MCWATDNGGSLQALYEIETYASTDGTGTNLSLAATKTASESYGANPPNLAGDGNLSTYWQNAFPAAMLSWWRCQYSTAQVIRSVVIKPNATYYAKSYALERSNDGTSWTTIATRSTSGVSGATQTFTSIQ